MSTALALRLFAESGAALDAHVTLISDSAAYDVYVRGAALAGEAYRHQSKQLMVLLPDRMAVRYAYIDSYALDGSALTPCATMVSWVQVWQPAFAGDRLESPDPKGAISATYRQPLPALSCGKVYTPARVLKVGRRVKPGAYGNARLLAQVRIYLDSDGKPIKEYVYKSSGVPGIDSYALYMAEASTYAPATFLCTPVVSDYLFKLDYGP
jgi:hypothetical protein